MATHMLILTLTVVPSLVFFFFTYMHSQPVQHRYSRRSRLPPRQAEDIPANSSSTLVVTRDTSVTDVSSTTTSLNASTITTTTSTSTFSTSQSSFSSKSTPLTSSSSLLPTSSLSSSSISIPKSTSSPESILTRTILTSSSSSSQASSTSNQAPTSHQALSSLVADPTPVTTLIVPPNSSTTIAVRTSTLAPSSTSNALSAVDSGFFANKGAVAGTFTIVGLVGVGIAIGLLIFMRRRVKNTVDRGSEFFESFSARHPISQASSNTGKFPPSPGPSINELSSLSPMDPHTSNNSYQPFGYNHQDRDRHHGLAPIDEHGTQSSFPASAPQMFDRPGVHRHSYQPSIDSFYGRD